MGLTGEIVDTLRPLSDPGKWIRVNAMVAFLTFAALGLAADILAPVVLSYSGALVAAGLTLLLSATPLLPWGRWQPDWQAAFPAALFGIVVLLDYAGGLFYLGTLPVIWVALFHSRRFLLVAIGLFAGATLIARAVRPEGYPLTNLSEAALIVGLISLVGLAAQSQVHHTRTIAARSAANARQAQADRDLLNAYLDHAGCLVVVLAPDRRVLLFNSFAEQVLGYRADDVVGEYAQFGPNESLQFQEAIERVIAGDWPLAHEGDSLTRAGEKRRIVWNTTALVDEHTEEVTHIIATGVDITEQRAAERLFANVLAAAAEQMIMATDIRGVIIVFNVGAERHLGYTAEEIIGGYTLERISAPDELTATIAEYGAGSLQELLADPEECEARLSGERTLVRKDGTRLPAMMTVGTMRDGPDPVGYVIVARDITVERAAEAVTLEALEREREAAERLRELDQVKNDFVAAISHDLRTPLTSIVGNTELLLDTATGDLAPAQRKLLDAVERNARRLDTLLGDLLLLSRIESGTMRMQPRPVAVNEIIDGALEALTSKLDADIALEVERPAAPVLVQGDPAQLERVTMNLVGNALKFTPPGGRVSVTVGVDTDRVRLSVSDTGIGIPEEEMPQVFDRFFRSSRSQEEHRPGTGLGLAIAKSIVEYHHGTIEVSGNPAGGTTFTITLPRLVGAQELSTSEP